MKLWQTFILLLYIKHVFTENLKRKHLDLTMVAERSTNIYLSPIGALPALICLAVRRVYQDRE